MSQDRYFIAKELSWLSFNERVLQEAEDQSVPIIERVRFLGIYSSNLDEFYQVRFSDVKRKILINEERPQNDDAKKLMSKIQNKINKLNQRFEQTYSDVLREMARRRIFLVNENQLTDDQIHWLRSHFISNLLPYITPIILQDKMDVLTFLKDACAYLAVELKKTGHSNQYALIEIPTKHTGRFIKVPEPKSRYRRNTIILLDNVIRLCLDEIFSSLIEYDSVKAYAMKMTRDAEYDFNQELEHSLLENMSDSLRQRLTAMPVRFSYQHDMPKVMVEKLSNMLKISDYDAVQPSGRYPNLKDFIQFPNFGIKYLEHPPFSPIESTAFRQHPNAFSAIRSQDILLYYPYHSFRHMTEFLRQASFDPKVRSIRINIYRVAKNSRIINSMIEAAKNDKNVTAIIELQARFDEQANIKWARKLRNAGVKVVFSPPGLKIHAKLCLISRFEENGIRYYAHLGTGNFHEKTANTYTDFSLFTAEKELTYEIRQVFNFIVNPFKPIKFHHLFVSPLNTRTRIHKLVEREIEHANAKRRSGITLKLNNLVDYELIHLLYKASSEGVKIRLIIRGMCSLIPGIPELSDNIKAISIVDRFLEHPRVLAFENGGEKELFISSADWMTRNMDDRIEVSVPINDKKLKQRILDILELQFCDRVKARVLDKELSNQYVKRGNRRKIRSQIEIYNYLKKVERNEKRRTSEKNDEREDNSK